MVKYITIWESNDIVRVHNNILEARKEYYSFGVLELERLKIYPKIILPENEMLGFEPGWMDVI